LELIEMTLTGVELRLEDPELLIGVCIGLDVRFS
jgi:hypothetical protein